MNFYKCILPSFFEKYKSIVPVGMMKYTVESILYPYYHGLHGHSQDCHGSFSAYYRINFYCSVNEAQS